MEKLFTHRYQIIALLAVTCCNAMLFLDATVLPVALPTIQRDLQVSSLGLQWLINAYLLAMASLVIAGGRIGDLYGHRKMFLGGVVVFAIASAMCAFAQSEEWFIFSRFIQGVGGALMSPASIAILFEIFPVKKRGRAVGILIGISSLFLSIGPFIGGFFSEYLTWRLIFWMNLPIALFCLIATLIAVPKSKKIQETFDVPGFLSLSLGIFCLIFGLMEGKEYGWGSPLVLISVISGSSFLLLLFYTDRRAKHPFIDFSLFKIRAFSAGICLVFFTQFILMTTVFWPIYFQEALYLSPFDAGLVTLASSLPIIITGPLAGQLFDRKGPRLTVTLGLFFVLFAFIWIAIFIHLQSVWMLLPGFLPFGSGISMILSATGVTALTDIPAQKRGTANGIYNTSRFSGATMGVALIGALLMGLRIKEFTGFMGSNNETKGLNPRLVMEALVGLKVPEGKLHTLSQAAFNYLKTSFVSSWVYAFTITMIATAIIIACLIIIPQKFFKKKLH